MNKSMRVELFLFWRIVTGYIRIYFVPLIFNQAIVCAVSL